MSKKEFENKKAIVEKLNKCNTDLEMYDFMMNNKSEVLIRLDNDATYLEIKWDNLTKQQEKEVNELNTYKSFEDYFGNGAGTENFFNYLGIDCDSV